MNSNTESNQTNTWRNETLFARVFYCDLRSLAAMRIALGVLILIDLAMRWNSIEAMYTDAGFFPVADWARHIDKFSDTAEPISWSLHALSGSKAWQLILFACAGIAAVMLTIGWKTRLACVISWVLLASLQIRNPMILHSGDCLFRLTMFWGMFLPLGAMWSVDRKRQRRNEQRDESEGDHQSKQPSRRTLNPVVSGATCGLILTLFSLYFFAGLSKWNSTWLSGHAMDCVLKLNIYTTSFGVYMLQFPTLLKLITWGTLAAEIVLPVMMLLPWRNERWRYLALIAFVGLHIGIAACMNIGLFSWVAIAVWMALLPASFWNRVLAPFGMQPKTEFNDSNESNESTCRPGLFSGRVGWVNGFCLAIAAYFMVWNLATIDDPFFKQLMPQQARVVGKWLNTRQSFRMFDTPPKHSPWFVYEAELNNGTKIDIYRNRPVKHDRPESILETIPHHHWRRLHRNLVRPHFTHHRKPIAEYLIRRWNASHDESSQVKSAKWIVYMDEINPGEESQGMITQVWHQHGVNDQLFDDMLKKMKKKGIILP